MAYLEVYDWTQVELLYLCIIATLYYLLKKKQLKSERLNSKKGINK